MNFLSIIYVFFITLNLYSAPAPFPENWWKPVPKEDAKPWEILPQDAVKNVSVILSKRTELGVFSNLAETPFTLDGEKYASVEGLWQSTKYPENDNDPRAQFPGLKWSYSRSQVMMLSGFDAKTAGDLANENMKKMGIDWVSYKGEKFAYKTSGSKKHFEIVSRALREKIDQNKQLKLLLISTGNLQLLPDHKVDPLSPPAYKYFEIYMEIRKNLTGPF